MDLLLFIETLPLSIISILLTKDYLQFDKASQYIINEYKRECTNKEAEIKNNSEILKKIMTDYVSMSRPKTDLNIDEKLIVDYIYTNNKYEELVPLIDILIKEIPPKNLYNLFFNIDNLKLEHKNKFQDSVLFDTLGDYMVGTNTITLYSNKKDVLSHEFLHASSSIIKNDIKFCGFNQYNGINAIFDGLNEGYTEILNRRYFASPKIRYTGCYKLCQYIEAMFDNKKDMEIAYFRNDICKVIDTFLKYGSKDEFVYINECLDKNMTMPDNKQDFTKNVRILYNMIR